MASADDLVEAFDDLGYSLDDPKVVDRLTSLCDLYNIDENKISCEYLAFAKKKSLQAPTLDNLEAFDKEVLKDLQDHLKENVKLNVYDSTTIGSIMMDQDEEDVLGCYGSVTPKSSKASKRNITPESGISKRRLGQATPNTTLSPSSFSQTPTSSQGGKSYANRDSKGKVLIRFGESMVGEKFSWSNSTSDAYKPDIAHHGKDKDYVAFKDYRFMFERLREKAGFLDEVICQIGDNLKLQAKEEPIGFEAVPTNEEFLTVGRICCDSEGRLNANSLLLQGSQDLSRGRALPLDVSHVKEYSLFPGQVVVSSVTNPSGSRLIAHNLMSDASPKVASVSSSKLAFGDTLHVVVASGPYTTNDNLAYEPLRDLLDQIGQARPHVVILSGPFVDAKHPMIAECDTNGETFKDIFNRIVAMIEVLLADLSNTRVILQPCSSRDVFHKYIYPTPEFEIQRKSDRIMLVPDPALVSVDGIVFGFTATDVLFHLGKEEISYPPRSGDRIRRLATHLLQQRSFYPLFPPNEEMNIDHENLERLAKLDVQPHVMILPSDLLHFFKDVNGALVLNPQRLTKGTGGGVYARLAVQGPKQSGGQFSCSQVKGEIVRI